MNNRSVSKLTLINMIFGKAKNLIIFEYYPKSAIGQSD